MSGGKIQEDFSRRNDGHDGRMENRGILKASRSMSSIDDGGRAKMEAKRRSSLTGISMTSPKRKRLDETEEPPSMEEAKRELDKQFFEVHQSQSRDSDASDISETEKQRLEIELMKELQVKYRPGIQLRDGRNEDLSD